MRFEGSARRLHVARESLRAGSRQTLDEASRQLLLRDQLPAFDAVWSQVDLVPGWLRPINAAALFRLIQAVRPTTIVEIGSYLGRSTVLFALTSKHFGLPTRVVAIDPHTGDRQQLEGLGSEEIATYAMFEQFCTATGVRDMIEPIVATSAEAARTWHGSIDLLYIDGWHSYDAVVEDGKNWLPHLTQEGAVVFDDVLTYEEVSRAVDDLDRAGELHKWSMLFGQAIGGRVPRPPPGLEPLVQFASHRFQRWR